MKDLLELLHPLCFIMSFIGILIASKEYSNSQKMILKAKQAKGTNFQLFEKYCKEIQGHIKNTRSALGIAAILFFLTIFIHTVINTM